MMVKYEPVQVIPPRQELMVACGICLFVLVFCFFISDCLKIVLVHRTGLKVFLSTHEQYKKNLTQTSVCLNCISTSLFYSRFFYYHEGIKSFCSASSNIFVLFFSKMQEKKQHRADRAHLRTHQNTQGKTNLTRTIEGKACEEPSLSLLH